ncbi:MAG: hypothetical protein K8F91_00470 [Candidatus Obscuribacterales bacterium]|nr:hypothetical protein [Candidatus Obscuribacterales bacterium]
MSGSKDHVFCDLLHRKGGAVALPAGLHRIYLGRRQGQGIWIVDGFKVVRHLYPPFVMGGNDQRYRFNPDNDVWIDNRIGCEEIEYTIAHELIERKFMRERGMTYDRAHSFGLLLEKNMRDADRLRAIRHGKKADPLVAPVYRSLFNRLDGISVWIVDGPVVRREIDGDFCFGGNDLSCQYIPAGEIWLDSSMSSEHTFYALKHQVEERKRLSAGMSWNDAYESALALRIVEQERQEKLANRHEARLADVIYGVRERGVKHS